MSYKKDGTYEIIGCAYEVFKHLGSGCPESDYQRALMSELHSKKFKVVMEKSINFKYKHLTLKSKRVDLVVNDEILIELKVNTYPKKAHIHQLLGYLKNAHKKTGLLLCFNSDGVFIKRVTDFKETPCE